MLIFDFLMLEPEPQAQLSHMFACAHRLINSSAVHITATAPGSHARVCSPLFTQTAFFTPLKSVASQSHCYLCPLPLLQALTPGFAPLSTQRKEELHLRIAKSIPHATYVHCSRFSRQGVLSPFHADRITPLKSAAR